MLEPIKIVEVEVEPPLDTFSRLGQGFSIAASFVKETTQQAAEELSEFKVNFFLTILQILNNSNSRLQIKVLNVQHQMWPEQSLVGRHGRLLLSKVPLKSWTKALRNSRPKSQKAAEMI